MKQKNLGISKGPFQKRFDSSLNATYYSILYTPGDLCVQNESLHMQLKVEFKCIMGRTSWSQHLNKHTTKLLDSSEKCKLEVEIEMPFFCAQIEDKIEQEESQSCILKQKVGDKIQKVLIHL